MARAAAHGTTKVPRFTDPTALALLPDDARKTVEQFHAGERPRRLRDRLARKFLEARTPIMVARTVAIDDAIRAAVNPQLVILGAGLDGRAWRMPELRDVTVFEVDHPDSQRDKRTRSAALTPTAREVRFVTVDFTRDRLGDALAAAGHDAARPTTWVWEGVVMYLSPAEIEATLAVIAERSAPGSRLIVVYHRPSLVLRLQRPIMRRIGEPLRSAFAPEAMAALLATYGFRVAVDQDLAEIGQGLSLELGRAMRRFRRLRIATADRSEFESKTRSAGELGEN
jgi:methyltransferase (TIGR00027 family)